MRSWGKDYHVVLCDNCGSYHHELGRDLMTIPKWQKRRRIDIHCMVKYCTNCNREKILEDVAKIEKKLKERV